MAFISCTWRSSKRHVTLRCSGFRPFHSGEGSSHTSNYGVYYPGRQLQEEGREEYYGHVLSQEEDWRRPTTPTFQRSMSIARSGSPSLVGLHAEGDSLIRRERELQLSGQNMVDWSSGESDGHHDPEINEEDTCKNYDVEVETMTEEYDAFQCQQMEGEIVHKTDSDKRRERRHAIAEFVKEGDRRRRQGLKRNLLKVDEYRKKPHGAGLTFWRKDLSLLSMKLDPTIANITQQPEGVVKEIAEWVQHTWEYNHPIKFEFVRKAIARGVILRRATLGKN